MITQNGKAKAVLQDIETYEKNALLTVMELGRRQVKDGKAKPLQDAFDELDVKIRRFKGKMGVAE